MTTQDGWPINAHWDNEQYNAEGHDWHSEDGDNWVYTNGKPVEEQAFYDATIRLMGGPRAGTLVS